MKERHVMKQFFLPLALAGLGMAAVPAQAYVTVPVTVLPNFTASLTGIPGGPAATDILATGVGGAYSAGQFTYDAANGQLDIFNFTAATPDPNNPFLSQYDIASAVAFTNLSLTEMYTTPGVTGVQTLLNVPLYTDPLTQDSTTLSPGTLDTATGALYGTQLDPSATLVSARLTGSFDAGQGPGVNQKIQIVAVPEPDVATLLLLGLVPAVAPILRARRSRRA